MDTTHNTNKTEGENMTSYTAIADYYNARGDGYVQSTCWASFDAARADADRRLAQANRFGHKAWRAIVVDDSGNEVGA